MLLLLYIHRFRLPIRSVFDMINHHPIRCTYVYRLFAVSFFQWYSQSVIYNFVANVTRLKLIRFVYIVYIYINIFLLIIDKKVLVFVNIPGMLFKLCTHQNQHILTFLTLVYTDCFNRLHRLVLRRHCVRIVAYSIHVRCYNILCFNKVITTLCVFS